MLKFGSIILLSSTLCSTWASADVNINTMIDDHPSDLKSIPFLHSLKINPTQLQFRAPYVHELKTVIVFEHYLLSHRTYQL